MNMPTPPEGFDPETATEFVNVSTEKFTQVPKDSHRDTDYKVASILGIGLLTLYLSNKTGWPVPNAEKLATQYKEGAARIRDALTDLEEAGWLVRFSLQTKGIWRTHTFVSNDPATLDKWRDYKAALEAARIAAGKAPQAGKAPRPARTKKATGGDKSTFAQVAPDGSKRDSVDRHPADGVPASRDSVDRDSVGRDLKEQETRDETLEENKNPLPSGTAVTSLPREVEAESEGDDFSESEKQLLNAAVERALAARSGRTGWSQQAIVAAMQGQLGEGFAPARVAAALVAVADDPEAKYPGRIEFVLNAPPPAPERPVPSGLGQQAAAPAWVAGPVKYLAPGTAMCKRHQGEPALGCNRCAAEVKGADVDAESVTSGRPMSRDEALALARASVRPGIKLRRREAPWKPEQVRAARPADLLAAVVEDLGRIADGEPSQLDPEVLAAGMERLGEIGSRGPSEAAA